jgi:hypothetical protein
MGEFAALLMPMQRARCQPWTRPPLVSILLISVRRFILHRSSVHGRGVLARTCIEAGDSLVEYIDEVTSWRLANLRY